jgi:LysR family transcriptional activator of nhaA
MLNYNHLYYFYITAQLGSFTKASQFLLITQPSLSIQLKTLENVLGFKLFIRSGKTIALTDKGKVIYEYSQRMFIESEGISNFINNKEKLAENFKIGVSDQVERPFIADVVGKFVHECANKELPTIRMESFKDDEMISHLKLGKLDLVISPINFANKGIDYVKYHTPIALVGNDKELQKLETNYKTIKNYFKHKNLKLVTSIETFILRNETDYYLSKINSSKQIVFESGNLAAMTRAITEGLGVGFLPSVYVRKEILKKSLFQYMPLGGVWKHNFYLYYSSKTTMKDSTKNFIETFEDFIG